MLVRLTPHVHRREAELCGVQSALQCFIVKSPVFGRFDIVKFDLARHGVRFELELVDNRAKFCGALRIPVEKTNPALFRSVASYEEICSLPQYWRQEREEGWWRSRRDESCGKAGE